jgi:hypothetical protein
MRRPFLLLFTLSLLPLRAQQFRVDDPLDFEPAARPVDQPAVRKLSDYYDILKNTLATPGELNRKSPKPIRARSVNTLGEPLQGAWWVKRHYYKTMSLDELVAGPGIDHPPSEEGPWTVVSAKSEGITPGFTILDAKQGMYFIKFDPISNPEMATGADQVAIRLVYALGYHVPENYLVDFSGSKLKLGKEVTLTDRMGRKRRMTERDLDELLKKAPRDKEGRYRVTASRAVLGKGIGPYRFAGTRSDDPNDFVPHEHRRDLRGFAVVAAWINHNDSRALNTYDSVVEENGANIIRHYVLDLGSTFGSGTQMANSPRSGGEYLFGWKQSAVQLFSVGLAVPYWAKARYPDLPSIGRFEYKTFDPDQWAADYPNPAFLNRLPDDEFWAAKQILAFRDEELRAIVHSARYSDPKAEAWLLECLIQRRDKIGRTIFAKVLPIDKFEIRGGRFVFGDLSEKAHLGGAGPYTIRWLGFDNETGAATPIEGSEGPALPAQGGNYKVARITSAARAKQVVDVTIRLEGAAPTIVGIDRRW